MKTATMLALCLFCVGASGETNKPVTIKGTLEIKYESRTTSNALDVYALSVNMSDSAIFRGFITNTPFIAGGLLGKDRLSSLNYQVECDVVNPANPAQTKNIGKMYGTVPISSSGVYGYGNGTLKVSVYPTGRAQGFDSRYGGTAAGKPLVKPSGGFLSSIRKEALSFQKKIQGRTVSLAVTNYDRMVFNSHKMAVGPVQIYPEAIVNGAMVYDYERSVWHFQDLAVTYAVEGAQKQDKLSGTIRWVEQPKRGQQRLGQYEFDVRVNEPASTGAAVFAGAASESEFFEVDTTIPSLTGTMKYTDSFQGEKVSRSSVVIDLIGNQLTRQQGMNLCKLILLSAIVPINAE